MKLIISIQKISLILATLVFIETLILGPAETVNDAIVMVSILIFIVSVVFFLITSAIRMLVFLKV